MNAQDREPAHTPARPPMRLLPRTGEKRPAEVKPLPARDEDHPADEPGYGHGV
jgi:hypothetical protein